MSERGTDLLGDATCRRYAVLTAAGLGTRLGVSAPKALLRIGGQSLVVRALQGLVQANVLTVVITAPPESLGLFQAELAPYVASLPSRTQVSVIPGGSSRQLSVAAGLDELRRLVDPEPHSVVLIHDAARPLTPPDMIERVASTIESGCEAVIPAIDVTDTLKEVHTTREDKSDLGAGDLYITKSVDRRRVRAAQTPQGFTWGLISRAHQQGYDRLCNDGLTSMATDDASLVEAMGVPVRIIQGDQLALKITRPLDVTFARILLENM